MNQPFLARTAEHLLHIATEPLHHCAVVLPSRRAAVYFRKHLTEQLEQPQFAPHIFTLDNFVEQLTPLKPADRLELIFTLFQSYREVWQSDAESFGRFLKWAPLALRDFSEVDAYLIDNQSFFRDLTNLKELDEWSLNEDSLTDNQQQYAWFWKKLGALYTHFTELLKKNGVAYQGLVFRDAANRVDERRNELPYEHIIFAGFNALSASEKKIMQSLRSIHKATILWDSDAYFANYPGHEADLFMKRNRRDFDGEFLWQDNVLETTPREIEIAAAPNELAQCDWMAQMLRENPNVQNTAIVLADEKLLPAVLQALPEDNGSVNVTMGFPTAQSPAHSLFNLLFEWLESLERDEMFHYRTVFRLLLHPYLQLSRSFAADVQQMLNRFRQENRVMLSVQDLLESCEHQDTRTFLESLLSGRGTNNAYLHAAQQLLQGILTPLSEQEGFAMEKEYLFHYLKVIRRLELLAAKFPEVLEREAFPTLFQSLAAGEKLNLVGEPLTGLEVMGMLETRALDFDRLIVLTCNEHVMPGSGSRQSLIPFELKKFHRLPTHQEHEAIFAYHFYRLLTRTKHATLLYSTNQDAWHGSERSRYLEQISHDWQALSNITLKHRVIQIADSKLPFTSAEVIKTPAVLQSLKERCERGLSPSALMKYLECPLDFYHYYVLGYNEPDELEETIEASTLGSVVHKVLEDIYKPFEGGNNLEIAHLEAAIGKADEMCKEQFREIYSKDGVDSGLNHLIFNVASGFVKRFLSHEIDRLKGAEKPNEAVQIKSLELELKHQLTIQTSIGAVTVNMRGNADRVDECDGVLRIIDYKTGKVEQKNVSVSSPEDLIEKSGLTKALQLMTYAWMYRGEHNHSGPLQAGNISMRNLEPWLLSVKWGNAQVLLPEQTDEFEDILRQLLEEMFDTSKPFRHADKARYCVFCRAESEGIDEEGGTSTEESG